MGEECNKKFTRLFITFLGTLWKRNLVQDDEVGEVKEIHKLISSECIFIMGYKKI